MRSKHRWLIASAASLLLANLAFAQSAVRFSEIHYDNTGTDTGEAIEISGPAGTDLTGWQVVLYNGNGSASYNTQTLSGAIPSTCGARGVIVLNYPSNGIQNGGSGATATNDPDAFALVDAQGAVVEFLSYEGVLTAANGPAAGQQSIDIGVREVGSEPVGLSLQRQASLVWTGPVTATFGACNDDAVQPPAEVASVSLTPSSAALVVGGTQTFTATARDATNAVLPGISITWTSSNTSVAQVSAAGVATALAVGDANIIATAPNGVFGTAALHVAPPTTGTPDVRINEIHYDNVGTDVGEAIEIEGPAGADVTGFSLVLYDGNGGGVYGTQPLSGVLAAACGARGVLVVNFAVNGLQNGSPDGVALVDAGGQVVEFLSYEGSFAATAGAANGVVSTDIGVSEATSAPVGGSLQRRNDGTWYAGTASFGACNPEQPVVANSISFSGRLSSDPPLPVGFEDQLFATLRDASNVVVPTTFTWSSETPAIASIDAFGVLHALAEGTATVRATAADGTTATYSLPTRVAVPGGIAQYGNNTEFGVPTDADPSDDYLVSYEQYTSSYNPNRGAPNWVAYEFDASHFGAEDRCDCFTSDPTLPSTFTRLTTQDYTGAAAIAGFSIDRGHLARSFDRTTGSLDNARTFYFDNIIPQASDQNQGPWAALESDLGDLARVQNLEVYVIAGAGGNVGTLKNEGKVVIPEYTWKVAVILPRDHGLADIHDYRDVETIAVMMPNVPGIRNVPWQTYLTTIDAIETRTGYDLLALLPDDVEAAVESGTQPPLAAVSASSLSIAEGGAVTFSAAGATDPNGSVVSYAWDFGDGASGSGLSVSHVFAQDGVFNVRVTVTDNDGLTGTASVTVTVSNVTPVVAPLADAAVEAGKPLAVAGTFADPGADAWTATVDWGDGSTAGPIALSGTSYSLTHTFAAAGTYLVTVVITDDDSSATVTQRVTVTAPPPVLAGALPLIDGLVASGKISRAVGAVLKSEVNAAQALLDRGKKSAAQALLQTMVAELDLLVRLRVVSAAAVAPLRALLLSV